MLTTPKQDFSFDDSKYSSLTNSFASSTDSLAQKEFPKGVSQLFVSGESHFSTRSTVEFIGGDLRLSRSGEIQLKNLVQALSVRGQEKNESVQSSVIFSQLRESDISVHSSAEWSEGDCLSLLELLDLEGLLLESSKSMSLFELIEV